MIPAVVRGRLTFGGYVPSEVGLLIVLTILTSLGAAIAERFGVPLASWLAMIPRQVLGGQLWRLVTEVFLETHPLSLLVTCAMLYWFGSSS